MINLKERFKAVGLSLGLFVSYSALAVCKEQIFKDNYGDEKFVYPIVLVAIQSFVNVISAKAMMLTHTHPENETPQKYYIFISIFNILTSITSNMALQYVPYVVLVVGKASKPIPVMICTALIAKKVYTIQRYIFVVMIAFGVGLFVFKNDMTSSNEVLLGNILIFTSLFVEGLTGGAQAKMRISSKPSSINYMFYVNIWCTILTIPLIFINFEGLRFIQFCMRHNEAILYVGAATATGTVGHYFVAAMVSNFGPLPLTLVSTTRKFFTVLLSSLIFGNVLTWRQWLATVIIFEALTLDVFFGRRKGAESVVEESNKTINAEKTESKEEIKENAENISKDEV